MLSCIFKSRRAFVEGLCFFIPESPPPSFNSWNFQKLVKLSCLFFSFWIFAFVNSFFSFFSLKIIKSYGVWVEKKNYGRTYMGIERSTFLIDAKGKVAKVWRKVRVKGHAEAVLAAAKEI